MAPVRTLINRSRPPVLGVEIQDLFVRGSRFSGIVYYIFAETADLPKYVKLLFGRLR